jgi:glucosamine-phosphate N-acetyltransferase
MALQTPVSDATAPLFSSELISPEVLKALPEGYTCRPIQRQDYHNGFLDVLRVLTTVGDVSEEVLLPFLARLMPGLQASIESKS